MSRLTIIIPCLGPVEHCEDTLVSALQNRPAESEIVVVHTQPYADPYDLRREVRFLVVSGKPDVCALINSGLDVSTGEVVHLLSPDLIVSEGWTDAALRWFEAPTIGAVSPWLIASNSEVTAAGVAYSAGGSRWIVGGNAKLVDARHHAVVGPTLRGAFYRREALVSLGGMPTAVGDELADVDLALSMRRVGWKLAIEPCCRLSDRSAPAVPLRHGYGAGLCAERLFLRQTTNNKAWAYLNHPFTVAWDMLRQFPSPAAATQLAGRLSAWLERASVEELNQKIAAASEELAAAQERGMQLRVRSPLTRRTTVPLSETELGQRRRAA